jgi:hypothetical protein
MQTSVCIVCSLQVTLKTTSGAFHAEYVFQVVSLLLSSLRRFSKILNSLAKIIIISLVRKRESHSIIFHFYSKFLFICFVSKLLLYIWCKYHYIVSQICITKNIYNLNNVIVTHMSDPLTKKVEYTYNYDSSVIQFLWKWTAWKRCRLTDVATVIRFISNTAASLYTTIQNYPVLTYFKQKQNCGRNCRLFKLLQGKNKTKNHQIKFFFKNVF